MSKLDDVKSLDAIIRDMSKINSKLESGHVIYAWRDNRRLLAKFEGMRNDILEEIKTEEKENEK
jgi:hypothetical protein